jgi:glyoxylase-like metal-dependent hydrolase (beta-lactamase superfamily II)
MSNLMSWLDENEDSTDELIVFNSHADYDHIWGNCFFNGTILGHNLCRERIIAEGEDALEKYGSQVQGEVEVIPPNLVFEERVMWMDDGVRFFHTPGHTRDSASCYDERDQVLFVGDNIEHPMPYLNSLDFQTYLDTLNSYRKMEWKSLVTGHDAVQTDSTLLLANREYVSKMIQWDVDVFNLDNHALNIHIHNLSKLASDLLQGKIKRKISKHFAEAIGRVSQVKDLEIDGQLMRRLKEVAGKNQA